MEKCKAHGQSRLIGACEWQRLAHVTRTRVRAMAAQSGENQNAVYDKKQQNTQFITYLKSRASELHHGEIEESALSPFGCLGEYKSIPFTGSLKKKKLRKYSRY